MSSSTDKGEYSQRSKTSWHVFSQGIEGLLRYETVHTAQIFHRIFELSKYLQTRGMDILTAQHLVEGTEDGLRECARDFEGVKCAADEFLKWANGKLQEEEECELVV